MGQNKKKKQKSINIYQKKQLQLQKNYLILHPNYQDIELSIITNYITKEQEYESKQLNLTARVPYL